MEEKAADELGRCQCHVLDARSVAAVLPGEDDHFVRDLDQATIGDGDAVRIAAQVTQNLLGAGKRLLAVDYPIEPDVGRNSGTLRCKCSSGLVTTWFSVAQATPRDTR
jgi:hypothetical protein